MHMKFSLFIRVTQAVLIIIYDDSGIQFSLMLWVLFSQMLWVLLTIVSLTNYYFKLSM